MDDRYTFINSEFVLNAKANLPVADLCIQRGYGIFDFLRVYRNKCIFLDDHLERFFVSANEMRLPVNFKKPELKAILLELIQKNNIPNSGIRITLTGGCSPDGYNIATPNLVITQQPLEPVSNEIFERGLKLVSFNHQRQLPHVKTTDYIMAVWLQPYIHQKGAEDVLYHQGNIISECPRANIFIVTQRGEVVTPANHILRGVTRKKLLQIASEQYSVVEKDLALDEVYNAREVFITSTTKQVLPVTQVDDTVINNGKAGTITKHLHQLLTAAILNSINANRI